MFENWHFGKKLLGDMSDDELKIHLEKDRYGDFTLTGAIRIHSKDSPVPQEGYKYESYYDNVKGAQTPLMVAAATRDKLSDLFFELSDCMGENVDAILTTSHDINPAVTMYREMIDLPVLQSVFMHHENIILNDGCTGVAVMHPRKSREVFLDEHKILFLYAENLGKYKKILHRYGIPHNQELRTVMDGEHIHQTSSDYREEFHALCREMGIDDSEKKIERILKRIEKRGS